MIAPQTTPTNHEIMIVFVILHHIVTSFDGFAVRDDSGRSIRHRTQTRVGSSWIAVTQPPAEWLGSKDLVLQLGP
jgi:hypothetical protein